MKGILGNGVVNVFWVDKWLFSCVLKLIVFLDISVRKVFVLLGLWDMSIVNYLWFMWYVKVRRVLGEELIFLLLK